MQDTSPTKTRNPLKPIQLRAEWVNQNRTRKKKKKETEANMAATFSSPPSKHTDNDMEAAYLEHTETAFTAMQCCCASNKETSYSFV